MAPHVVLLGAGHAHLYTLKRTAEFIRRGFELTLVAPDAFWYSGLATGMLGGIYPPALDQIDVEALTVRGGGRFIRAHVTRIDVSAQSVYLDTGPLLSYGVVSCNLGSEVPLAGIPGASAHGYPVKPIRNLWQMRQALEARLGSSTSGPPLRVVIVGGGATACEIAANIQHLAQARRGIVQITVLAGADKVLKQMSPGAAAKVERVLRRRGITLTLRSPVVRVDAQVVVTDDGRQVPFDFLVHAIGLTPPGLLRATGLPTDEEGALQVDPYLRSVADPRVFGGGDCIAFQERNLAKIGVYAVRKAPILFHNLLATLQDRPLRPFQPQQRYLLILNLGDGTGLATWGRLYWHGRLAFWLKDRIDRAFLKEYIRPPSAITSDQGKATIS